jgi:hypothetical protein
MSTAGTAAVNPDPPAVAAADEGRHEPGAEPLWNESWYFDVADPGQRLGAYLRFGLYPNRGQTWFQLAVAGEGRPVIIVNDVEAPPAPGPGLALATDRWSAELIAGEPLRSWRVTARADTPEGVVVLDLTWTTTADPYHYGVATRYEVSCTVEGTIRVGAEEVAVRGTGQRDHSWGVRDWWAFGWCWSAGTLADGRAFHLADIRLPGRPLGFGYALVDGARLPATAIGATEELGGDGLPVRGRLAVEPGFAMTVTPVAVTPLVFTADDGRTARFPRALCRYRSDDGVDGWGWTEWNQID